MSVPSLFDRAVLRRRRQRIAELARANDFLFEAAAEELGQRLSLVQRQFSTVVDLGCHTGRLTEHLRQLDGTDVVISTDQIGCYASKQRPSIIMDEEILPFAHESVDLVTSNLCLHWINDLPGCLAQIKHALKPDGLFTASLFGAGTLTELRQSLQRAELELYGGASVRVAPFADIRDLGGLLQRAGFALPVIDAETITVRYRSPLGLIDDLRQSALTNPLFARARRPLTRRFLAHFADIYRDEFSDDDGRVRASFNIVYLSGWAPHASQQKPLAPGSAHMRLADALKST